MSDSGGAREARIRWEQLGWQVPKGWPAPGFERKSVGFLVVSPWCPDCQALGESWKELRRPGQACWLVGEFAPPAQVLELKGRLGIDWPVLVGTPEKSEVARIEARFRQIRGAFGDDRRWGVPSWIEGRLEHGWLVATAFRSNF